MLAPVVRRTTVPEGHVILVQAARLMMVPEVQDIVDQEVRATTVPVDLHMTDRVDRLILALAGHVTMGLEAHAIQGPEAVEIAQALVANLTVQISN